MFTAGTRARRAEERTAPASPLRLLGAICSRPTIKLISAGEKIAHDITTAQTAEGFCLVLPNPKLGLYWKDPALIIHSDAYFK